MIRVTPAELWEAGLTAYGMNMKVFMDSLVFGAQVAQMCLEDFMPSPGRRAIESVDSSHFGEHEVIKVAFDGH